MTALGSIKRLLEPLPRNGFGIITVLGCAAVLRRTWALPIITGELDLALLGLASIVIASLGLIVASGLLVSRLLGRPSVLGPTTGKMFLVSVLAVLLSYAIGWHLNKIYFEYRQSLILIAILAAGAIQSSIWDRDTSGRSAVHSGAAPSEAWVVPVLAVSLLFFLIAIVPSIRTVRFEDVFITFRYGWNLSQGHGINWNPTDPIPAEGYTTFLFVLLSALFFSGGVDPLVGAQVVGLLSLLLLCYLTWHLSRAIFQDEIGMKSLLSVSLLVSLPATAFHVATGMETMFFSASLAMVSWLAIKWLSGDTSNPRLLFVLGIAILVSALTRPEGAIYGLLTAIVAHFVSGRRMLRKEDLSPFIPTLAIPGAIYLGWHIAYFKSLLPLSFFHKSFVGSPYGHAARSVLFTDFAGMILLPSLGFVLYRSFSRTLPGAAYVMLVPAAVLVIYYSRVLAVAGLQYRFFFPYLFAFLVAASDDWAGLLSQMASRLAKIPMLVASLTLFTFVSLGPFAYEARSNVALFKSLAAYDEGTDEYVRIGRTLQAIGSDKIIGIGEVGKIGMLLRDYTLIDIVGLNDRYLARHAFSTTYLDTRQVDVLVVFAYPRAPLGVYSDVYRRVGEAFADIEASFSCIGNIRGLDVFVRREPVTLTAEILHALGGSPDFDEGICLSSTTARWSPETVNLPLSPWTYSQLSLVSSAKGIQLEVTGDDPILKSPSLGLNAEDFNNVFVTMRIPPPVSCKTLTLYFTRADATQESEARSVYVAFEPSDDVQTIIANVRMHPEWRGTISGLRIDPVCGLNQDGSPVRFELESISLH